jgi:hypothetical protein
MTASFPSHVIALIKNIAYTDLSLPAGINTGTFCKAASKRNLICRILVGE